MENWLHVEVLMVLMVVLTNHALNPGCECLVYSSTYGKEYGRFSSPDYPKSYPDDIDCLLYTFIAGSNEIVELNFKHFNLYPSNPECETGDYLKAYLELESAHLTDLDSPTGHLCSSTPSRPHLLYSSGPFLVLELHSSKRPKNANYSGFLGTFRFIDTSQYVMGGGSLGSCDYQIPEGGSSGRLYSPRYPSSYPRNSRCTYTISAREGKRVRLIFEEFDLQKGDESCLTREDVLRVHDGPGPLSPVITILCNQGSNAEIISSSESIFIEFSSSSNWPGHGFFAKYIFVSKTENRVESASVHLGPLVSATRSSCDVKLSSDDRINGSITSPGFPGPYPTKTTCQYEFSASGRQRVQIVFTEFSLFMINEFSKDCDGVDAVIIYVVTEGRVEKIESFCGSTLPKPIMSNGPRLIIHFNGKFSSRHSKGFRAKYKFVSNYGITGGEQVEDYSCAFRYRSTLSLSGEFTSPNFPGLYPRDTECHYFFHGSSTQRVRVTFYYFDIEGITPCDLSTASDYIEFSNYMGRDQKYKRHCGLLGSDFTVISERKFFRVTFRSNDKLDGTGFNATYEFVDTSLIPSESTNKGNQLRVNFYVIGVFFSLLSYKN